MKLNYKYGRIRTGTIQHARSFWQLLEIIKQDSFCHNKSNSVHDTNDSNYYKHGYGVDYWPQNLIPGSKEWYYVGDQYRYEDDKFPYHRKGFYRFIGSEGGFYNKLMGEPEFCQKFHEFLVFEDDAGNRIRVRPGTAIISEQTAKGWALREGFKLPDRASVFWPNAAKECGVENGSYKGQKESYSLGREIFDFIIVTAIWLLLCFCGSWNILFAIPFTIGYAMVSYVILGQMYYREITLKKEEK